MSKAFIFEWGGGGEGGDIGDGCVGGVRGAVREVTRRVRRRISGGDDTLYRVRVMLLRDL
jgi:hypothetical protein